MHSPHSFFQRHGSSVLQCALLVLDLGLNVFDSVRGLNIKSDGLASQRLDENLHTTTEAEDQVKGALLLDVVIAQGPAVLKLLTSENQALLVGWDTLLVLNLSLDILDRVGCLNVEGDSLAGESLNEDLHCFCFMIIKKVVAIYNYAGHQTYIIIQSSEVIDAVRDQ